MQEVHPDSELALLLKRYSDVGGVLDFVLLESVEQSCAENRHRSAALAGIAAIDARLADWATNHASDDTPAEEFFRVHWDEAKLTGKHVSFSEFWGADDVTAKPIASNAWSFSIPSGYKTAFFLPPHALRGSFEETLKLFEAISHRVLGSRPEEAEVYSWSTDWSNYFDAGHEWWGSFLWTVQPTNSNRITVIGASSTD